MIFYISFPFAFPLFSFEIQIDLSIIPPLFYVSRRPIISFGIFVSIMYFLLLVALSLLSPFPLPAVSVSAQLFHHHNRLRLLALLRPVIEQSIGFHLNAILPSLTFARLRSIFLISPDSSLPISF